MNRTAFTGAQKRALTALSAPPAQSEGDDELDRTKLIADAADAHAFSQWSDKLGHRRMEAALAVIEPAIRADERLAVARKALTPSPIPYVRPAAEIQAEIKHRNEYLSNDNVSPLLTFVERARLSGWIAALTWAMEGRP